MSWAIVRRGSRESLRLYVDRLYPTREEAQAALDEMLDIYPPESEWHKKIFVATKPPSA